MGSNQVGNFPKQNGGRLKNYLTFEEYKLCYDNSILYPVEIRLYQPKNPLLQQYIECFYILTRKPGDKPTSYLTFPSIFTMACISIDSKTTVKGYNVDISHSPGTGLETHLVCNFGKPACIKYEGAANEITIYFKPLGINAFLEKDLAKYTGRHFTPFYPFDDYKSTMVRIFSLKNPDKRIQKLEAYWLSRFRGFHHPFLYPLLDEIMHESSPESLSSLAAKHRLSRAIIHNHFITHISTSPGRFKKVARFRTAIKKHIQKEIPGKLTSISYDAAYFDQSHMIKDFRLFTGYTPKAFFSRLSVTEGSPVNWLFL